jgi:hypothetical protein
MLGLWGRCPWPARDAASRGIVDQADDPLGSLDHLLAPWGGPGGFRHAPITSESTAPSREQLNYVHNTKQAQPGHARGFR